MQTVKNSTCYHGHSICYNPEWHSLEPSNHCWLYSFERCINIDCKYSHDRKVCWNYHFHVDGGCEEKDCPNIFTAFGCEKSFWNRRFQNIHAKLDRVAQLRNTI